MVKQLQALVKLARPHQYIKNAFLFLPIFFGYRMTDPADLANVILAFISFSLAASSEYVLNDINDIDEDRNHPIKRNRPLASGMISKKEAIVFLGILAISSLFIAILLLNRAFLLILLAYIFLNAMYSYKLKHMAIVDIICVATGFVLRIFAGAVVVSITPSHWLVLMTFLLALFIALAKRRDDLLLASDGKNIRRCIDSYNFEFVSGAMMVMASVTIVSYILYTVSPEVISKHGTENLYFTCFWVIIGFLRYLQITFVHKWSGSPTQVIFKDIFLQIVIFFWLATFAVIFYVDSL